MKIGMLLADLHFGALPLDRYNIELEVNILQKIDEMEQLDFIIILGDIFDSKEYVSSDTNKAVIQFCYQLINRTEKFNTEIVIVEGTRGHDALQTSTLGIIFNKVNRFKVIDKVQKDKLCGTIRVLYIPEEFVVDQEVYYSEYFNDRYDVIFGHGMVDKMWFSSKKKSKNLQDKTTTPVFKTSLFDEISTRSYFGHIHTPKQYGHFKYVGSFSRWEFGQEEDKGYIIMYFNEKTKDISDEFIINEMAPIMITNAINITHESTLEEVNNLINKILDSTLHKVNSLRLVVNINSKLDNHLVIKDFIFSKINNIQNVSLIVNLSDTGELNKETTSDINTVVEKFNEMMNDTIPDAKKISIWIKNNRNKDISISEIEEFLQLKI